jgi:hypothetical protein
LLNVPGEIEIGSGTPFCVLPTKIATSPSLHCTIKVNGAEVLLLKFTSPPYLAVSANVPALLKSNIAVPGSGTHKVRASYAGNGNYYPSASSTPVSRRLIEIEESSDEFHALAAKLRSAIFDLKWQIRAGLKNYPPEIERRRKNAYRE